MKNHDRKMTNNRAYLAGNPSFQLRRPERAGYSVNFNAALEQGQRRNAADLILLREHLLRFGVHLGETHTGGKFARQLGKYGCEVLARPAPWRPKINHHGQLIVLNEF